MNNKKGMVINANIASGTEEKLRLINAGFVNTAGDIDCLDDLINSRKKIAEELFLERENARDNNKDLEEEASNVEGERLRLEKELESLNESVSQLEEELNFYIEACEKGDAILSEAEKRVLKLNHLTMSADEFVDEKQAIRALLEEV